MCKNIIANKGILALILIIAILIIDQTIKIAVKTSMSIGESIRITNWFYIYFIENNGMAYGVTLVNKLFLSVLRVIAVLYVGIFVKSLKRKEDFYMLFYFQ